jgi:DNA-binding NarL/FixJ family response regulator
MPISVSIVEDEHETCENIVALLGEAGIRCVNAYSTGEAALAGIPADKPDVALVDINLPGMSGIECVAKLKARAPQLAVLMLTTYTDTNLIFNALRAGAKGYVLKNMPPAELVHAVEQIHAGGAPMSMQIARKVVDHFCEVQKPADDVENLTAREHEVLNLLAQGYLYKEISDQLSISVHTVKKHLGLIYEKLHVQSRTEATAKFLRRN